MKSPAIRSLLRDTFREWRRDNTSQMAAALAFYSLFSLAPVTIVATAIAGFVFGQEAAQRGILERIRSVAGDEVARAVGGLVAGRGGAAPRITATIFGVAAFLVGATAVFADLQGSLNTIWQAQPKSGGVLGILRKRFLPFLMVVGIGLFLAASFGVSAALSALTRILGYRPSLPLYLAPHGAISFVTITFLFAMVYKLLPDAKILWSDVWIGALVTAFLFTIGKSLIGYYLGSDLIRPVGGRAGSLIAFLIWIYFSAQIFFLGAEFTHVYASELGSRTVPAPEPRTPTSPRSAANRTAR
jgi:membrane protein